MKRYKYYILSFIAGILATLIFIESKRVFFTPPNSRYVTDTISHKVPYVKPKPLPNQVKPNQVHEYLEPIIPDNQSVTISGNMLYIQSKEPGKEPVTLMEIPSKFILAYPKAPKLLNIDLQLDSLSLSIMGVDLIPRVQKYPLDLLHYKYRWQDNVLTSKKIPQIKPNAKRYNLYLFGGLDYRSPNLSKVFGGRYILNISPLQVEVEPYLIWNTSIKGAISTKLILKLR